MEEKETASARHHQTLSERAKSIKVVYNDIYTVKLWQLALNFLCAMAAVGLLVAGMILKAGLAHTLLLVFGFIMTAAVAIYNMVIRAVAPMSFLQYTAIKDGKRYCFQVINKNWARFSDGCNVVDQNKNSYCKPEELYFPYCTFDFFADMEVDERIGKVDREIFTGRLDVNGKTVKCSIVFKNGEVYRGKIGGVRIKYFNVNDSKEKFVVPALLKRAAELCDVPWPKLPGLYVRDPYVKSPNAVKK